MVDSIEYETLQNMVATGKDAVLQAGEVIRKRLGTPATVEYKDTFDYVTNVDLETETLIIEKLRKPFPDHQIISEETSKANLGTGGVTWIIDPLDGTTNFIHGFPFVAVSIAACVDGEVVLGFVLDPIRRELFWAKKGGGAFLDDRRISVRKLPSLKEALVATGFPFRNKHLIDPYSATFKRIFLQVSDIRRAGSAALDLSYVAAGRIDGFWEAKLSSWDVAAGGLLIREAGGMVSDFWGTERYIENGNIVAGSPAIYPFLLEHVRIFLAPSLEPIPVEET